MILMRAFRGVLAGTLAFLSVEGAAYAASPALAPVGVEGLWLSQDKDGIFEIKPCGGGLCVWLVGLDYKDHVPRDVMGRSECRLMMMTDFVPLDEKKWQGHILDPRTGHTYQARIWNEGAQVLKLRGFVLGVPLLGETQTWTRYEGPAVDTECHMVKMSQ